MAITNGYCTLSELKSRLDILGDSYDAILEQNIEAASRKIDGYCGRHFYSATETHYYQSERWDEVDTDDIVSVSSLTTDEDGSRTYATTWGALDFELGPGDSAPYTRIYATPTGAYAFPFERRSIRVAGTFGWSAVPDAVREATLILAARFYKRKDAPFGIAGAPELGQLTLPANDPDVIRLVSDYRKFALVGV